MLRELTQRRPAYSVSKIGGASAVGFVHDMPCHEYVTPVAEEQIRLLHVRAQPTFGGVLPIRAQDEVNAAAGEREEGVYQVHRRLHGVPGGQAYL